MVKLIDIIPEEELNEKIDEVCSELSYDYMGFEKVYEVVANNVPKDKIIVDIGCHMAPQAYYFLDYPLYIGVDNYDEDRQEKLQILKENNIDTNDYHAIYNLGIHYFPPTRFNTSNSVHVISDGSIWIKEKGWEKILGNNIDLNQIYVICSGVPVNKLRQLVHEEFPNCVVWYPGCETITKGINADEIKNSLENIKKR